MFDVFQVDDFIEVLKEGITQTKHFLKQRGLLS